MSDPPKKLGSLKDRIAAFENKGPAPVPAAAPVPRPKPAGGVSWKPKAPSPPSSPPAPDNAERKLAGMSAEDAKESIGKGGSLKERMAALQGRGAFGGLPGAAPVAPPKPAVEKPKWKPPPRPIASPPIDDVADVAPEAPHASPPTTAADSQEESKTAEPSGEAEPSPSRAEEAQESQEPDPEEEERQRRAAIAARMARLGGARVGMGPPPIFGKKPEVKKAETPKEEAKEEELRAPEERSEGLLPPATELVTERGTPLIQSPPAEDAVSTEDVENRQEFFNTEQTSTSSLLSSDSAASSGRSPSMPVPSVPRRTGPPRKKAAKSPSPTPPIQVLNIEFTRSPSTTPALDVQGQSKEAVEEAIKQSKQIEEAGSREPEITPQIPAEVETQIREETETEREPTRAPSSNVIPHAEEFSEETKLPTGELESLSISDDIVEKKVDEPEHHGPTLPESGADAQPSNIETDEVVKGEPDSDKVGSPPKEEEAQIEEPEEEDEAARRKRIAERLAKTGGVNPLAGPPPPARKPSLPTPVSPTESVGSRRQGSIDVAHSPTVSLTQERQLPLRRESTDSAILGKSTSLRKGSVDSVSSQPLRSPPLLPTSPKPTLPTRKDSTGSTSSGPQRRASQDDRKEPQADIGSIRHRLSTSEEISEEPEAYEDDVLSGNEGPEAEAGPREARDYSSEKLTASSRSVANYPADELFVPASVPTQGDDDDDRVSFLQVEDEEVEEPREYEPIDEEYSPPELNRVPSPVNDDVNLQEDVPVPLLPTAPRPPVKRTSIPPPPRAPPAVPESLAESAVEAEPRIHHVRPLPPPPPIIEEVLDRDADKTPSVLSTAVPPIPPNRPPPVAQVDILLAEDDDAEEKDSPSLSPIDSKDNVSDLDIQSDMDVPDSPPRTFDEEEPSIISSAEETPEYIDQDEESYQSEPAISQRRAAPQRHVPEPISTTSKGKKPEEEVLDDSDGDPIDPAFHSPLKSPTTSIANPPSLSLSQPQSPPPAASSPEEESEDEEQARRRTIAERMAKLGGIRFGAPPAPTRRPQPPPPPTEEGAVEDNEPTESKAEPEEPPEEEDEFSRKQRIAARIAGMGGMRFGMLPTPMSPPVPPVRKESVHEPISVSSHAVPAVHPASGDDIEDEGVQVDVEESELEEVSHSDIPEEVPPPVPTRAGRRSSTQTPASAPERAPPVPSLARPPVPLGRPPIPPTPSGSRGIPSPVSGRKSSASTETGHPLPSPPAVQSSLSPAGDYVLVDEPESAEELPPPPPPPRSVRVPPPPRSAPLPPPPPVHGSADEVLSDFEAEVDLSLSGQWSEDSTNYPISVPPPPPPSKRVSTSRPESQRPPSHQPPVADLQLSPDELMALWGRVGVQVNETAATLFDKSRKSLVGDGSYVGFINATLSQVPNAARPSAQDSFGYLIYSQSGAAVQRRVTDIMPGDIIVLQDAKLKGHKGIQMYHQTVGAGEPVVAIVADFEVKKSKVKVFQANQHVGHQSVESTSYRLEDLKSGTVKVFRVLSS